MGYFELIRTIAAILGAVGLPPLAGLIVWSVKQIRNIRMENKKREERHDKGLQIVIRFHLNSIYYQAKERGKIKEEDLRIWIEGYEVYHGLGENGIMDKKRDEMLSLPICEDY